MKEVTVDTINYLCWRLNYLLIFVNTVYTDHWTQVSERDFSWKTSYAMILCNNTKLISSQLFRCGKTKFEPLRRGHLQHLFITTLLLVWSVGHMDPHITDWVTKPGKVPRKFELATYWFRCDALTCWAIRNTLCFMWQNDRRMGEVFQELAKG